jgi:prepilin-type N-terminal cleavage/methylation domain-containing protein
MLRLARRRLSGRRGFTLTELLVVLAVIAILTAIAIPLFASTQQRARRAKALGDVKALSSALSIYMAHCGGFPAPGSAATNCPVSSAIAGGDIPGALYLAQVNVLNQSGGPFLNSQPTLPTGWAGSGTSYKYSINTTPGMFVFCATGDGTGADSNGGAPTICP